MRRRTPSWRGNRETHACLHPARTFSSWKRSLAALQCAATSDSVMSRLPASSRLSSARALWASSYTHAFSPICARSIRPRTHSRQPGREGMCRRLPPTLTCAGGCALLWHAASMRGQRCGGSMSRPQGAHTRLFRLTCASSASALGRRRMGMSRPLSCCTLPSCSSADSLSMLSTSTRPAMAWVL